jgi:hypothetical protein
MTCFLTISPTVPPDPYLIDQAEHQDAINLRQSFSVSGFGFDFRTSKRRRATSVVALRRLAATTEKGFQHIDII